MALQFFNVMSGINVVNFYSSIIFSLSGIDPLIGTFMVGIANLSGTLIPLGIINKLGRKALLCASFLLMTASHAVIVVGIIYDIPILLTGTILFFIIAYQLGAGPIPAVYLTDICLDASMSMGMLSFQLAMLLSSVLPPLTIAAPSIGLKGTFIGELIFCGIASLFCIFVIKETKGLSDQACKTIYSTTKTTKYSDD